MKLEVRDTLECARRILARGWCQGARSIVGFDAGENEKVRHVAPGNEDQQCYCLYGAVLQASTGIFNAHAALAALSIEDSYVRWNDDPDRTHEEVLALFDAAMGANDEQ